MAVAPGTILGGYEIVALLGKGGMGEVYRARDAKLGRDVAIKILPDAFTGDPDRVARFEREAQVLASLNHPGIAVIFGLEQAGPVRFLAMELVDGESLADRVGRAPDGLPLDEALPMARAIAEALQAAHEKGIVHRDLKPANIMVTGDGRVKILDFGLARVEPTTVSGGAGVTQSPTLTFAATQAGMILGTAAYMSPEQAKGRVADKRSDIWSFGCVLFEMVTGRRAFGGEDATETLAAVVRGEPDWSALPPSLPPNVRTVLTRSITKDRNARLTDVSIVLFLLEQALPAAAGAAAPRSLARSVPLVAATAAIAAFVGVAAAWAWRPRLSASPIVRFSIPLGDGQQFTNTGRQVVAISPDGTRIVYVANQRLYVRDLSTSDAQPVAGAESETGVTNPVFSPDGQWLVYYADNALRKIAITGGASIPLCQARNPAGIIWTANEIVFGQATQGIMRVSPDGGNAELIAAARPGDAVYGPQLLPGRDAILFSVLPASAGVDNWEKAQIVVQQLKTGERKTIVSGGADGRYLPTGHLIYALSGALYAARFDPRTLTLAGAPTVVLEGVARAGIRGATGTAQFSVSDTGSLVYVPGPSASANDRTMDVALLDRQGAVQSLKLPPAPYLHPRVSRDGKRLAVDSDGVEAIVWVYDLSGTTSIRRLTFTGRNLYPVWSPDGDRLAFQSNREGDQGIFLQRADGNGAAERLTKAESGLDHVPEAWSPDGKVLLFSRAMGSNYALYAVSIDDKRVAPVADIPSVNPVVSAFSPDGKWIAYAVARGGAAIGVFVQAFPPTGGRYEVTRATQPLWSPDGSELFARSAVTTDGRFLRVGVTVRPTVSFTYATELPIGRLTTAQTFERSFDIMPDGKRFVGIVEPPGAERAVSPQIRVVEHWFDELNAKVPAK